MSKAFDTIYRLQLRSIVATGFNQRKPPHRTICVAVDLMAAFDTANHNVLLSKIVRIVHTDVPQGSKLQLHYSVST